VRIALASDHPSILIGSASTESVGSAGGRHQHRLDRLSAAPQGAGALPAGEFA